MRFFFRSLSLSPHQTFSPKQKPSLPLSTSCRLSLLHRLRPRPQDHQPPPAPGSSVRLRGPGSGARPLGPRRLAAPARRRRRGRVGGLASDGRGALPGAVVRCTVRRGSGARRRGRGDVRRELRVLPLRRRRRSRIPGRLEDVCCQQRSAAAAAARNRSSLQACVCIALPGCRSQVEGRRRRRKPGRGGRSEGEGEEGSRDADGRRRGDGGGRGGVFFFDHELSSCCL